MWHYRLVSLSSVIPALSGMLRANLLDRYFSLVYDYDMTDMLIRTFSTVVCLLFQRSPGIGTARLCRYLTIRNASRFGSLR